VADRLSYEDWASRLRAHFFEESNAGVPVTFFVDGEVLAEIAGVPEQEADAAEAWLASAVRPKLLPESSGDVFSRVVDESWTWRLKHPDHDPPFLPVLAITVLAAAKMARTQDRAAHNYYRPLRKVLGLQDKPGMPPGYDAAMQGLWGHLTWWLNVQTEGRLGLSSVPDRPSPAYIGYALSQALFRASDRQRLTHFFTALDIAPGEPIEAAELLAYFRAWCQRSHLSSGAMEMARREEYAEPLAAILAAELRRWDGSLRDERGRRLGQILITLDLYLRPRLAFAAERPHGFPAPAAFEFDETGRTVILQATGSDFYDELPFEVSAQVLETGMRGVHDGVALGLSPGPIVPFRQHEALGCWASVRQLVPGIHHWVLVRADHDPLVREYLRDSAMADWREAQGIAPRGWTFFRDVVIDAAPPSTTNPALSRIVPSLRERPSLWGGLPLSINPDLYLAGGEPDLWVPTAQDAAAIPIAIDGQEMHVEFTGGRVALRDRGLEPGSHEIRVGPSRLTFQTANSLGVVNSRSAGALAHSLLVADGSYRAASAGGASEKTDESPPGTLVVIGISLFGASSDLPSQSRAPLLLPAKAGEYVLLGSVPGDILRPRVPPEAPRWVDRIAPFAAGREFVPPFDVVWVLIRWRTGGWEARLRDGLDPKPSGLDGARSQSVREWCTCLLQSGPELAGDALKLWKRYQEVAEGLMV
jgi:hypothetical protein